MKTSGEVLSNIPKILAFLVLCIILKLINEKLLTIFLVLILIKQGFTLVNGKYNSKLWTGSIPHKRNDLA